MIRCILYPGAKLFIASGGKEQAANIAKEKIEEIFELLPALRNEVDLKKSTFGKDYVRLEFKNGSRMDVVAVKESARGGRRHGEDSPGHGTVIDLPFLVNRVKRPVKNNRNG